MNSLDLGDLDGDISHVVRVIMKFFHFFFRNFATVLVSRPSAGKGDLSEFLRILGFEVISCSGALTEMVEANPNDPEMQEVRNRMGLGKLVEERYVLKALRMKLSLCSGKPLAFDGFPRDDMQVKYLKEILGEMGFSCFFLELDCSLEQANIRRIQRMHKAYDNGCTPRADDLIEETWMARQQDYDLKYPGLKGELLKFASYRRIDTTNPSKPENHALALKEIFVFAVLNHLGLSKRQKDFLLKKLV